MKKADIEKEKLELERLVRNGFNFYLEYDITTRNWFGKKKKEHRKEQFHIEEPTLGTLDRMSNAIISIEDVKEFDSKVGIDMKVANEMAAKYTRAICRVIAYAVAGSDYAKMKMHKGRRTESVDEEYIDELVDIFMHCMKPSDMKEIMMYVLAIRNMQDFMISTMLMSAGRTSHPDMVDTSD